jgi:hypothetical protein
MAQDGLREEHMNKCGHQGCVCVVEPSQSYCSEYCARASGASTSNELPGHIRAGRCECGHAACDGQH